MADKTLNMAIVYSAIAILSVLLLVGYLLFEKKKERLFVALFACVAVVNCGYFLQATSSTLPGAMTANRISYLGAAYSILVMLLIILDVCQVKRNKWLNATLITISTFAFLLAASGRWQGLYYRDVSIEMVNGMTRLVKEYGPLHILYPVYLLSYFALMVAAIARAAKRKLLSSPKYAIFLASVVLLNICVWAVEQVIDVDFEFLSVSYIATEIMLVLLYGMLRDFGILEPCGTLISAQMLTQIHSQPAMEGQLPPNMEDLFQAFSQKAKTLSSAEQRILNYYIEGHEISEIPELAFISIHTVKKHNRSIYQKLDIASRDELMLYIELFRCCGRLGELTEVPPECQATTT
jgi:DNA-binding CsgD family transcriptional regulator